MEGHHSWFEAAGAIFLSFISSFFRSSSLSLSFLETTATPLASNFLQRQYWQNHAAKKITLIAVITHPYTLSLSLVSPADSDMQYTVGRPRETGNDQ